MLLTEQPTAEYLIGPVEETERLRHVDLQHQILCTWFWRAHGRVLSRAAKNARRQARDVWRAEVGAQLRAAQEANNARECWSVRVHSLARGCWRGTVGVEAAEESVRTSKLGLSTWRGKVGKVGRVRIHCGAARVKVCIMC